MSCASFITACKTTWAYVSLLPAAITTTNTSLAPLLALGVLVIASIVHSATKAKKKPEKEHKSPLPTTRRLDTDQRPSPRKARWS